MTAFDTVGHTPASVALLPDAGASTSAASAPAAAGTPEGGTFAGTLATAMSRSIPLPTVTMDQMVSALSGGGAGLTQPGLLGLLASGRLGGQAVGIDEVAAAGGVSSAGLPSVNGPSDDWGVAAERPASSRSGPGTQVLTAGERYLGVPYKWGGTSPDTGFDCSGFVQRVFADLGVRLPRVSIDQSREGVAVPGLEHARPGDLVFWRGNGSRPNHIAIYAGEGRMLVAPRSGDVVRYQEIRRPPDAVRRIIA